MGWAATEPEDSASAPDYEDELEDDDAPIGEMTGAWLRMAAGYRLLSASEEVTLAKSRNWQQRYRPEKKVSPVCTCCRSPEEALTQHNYRLIVKAAKLFRRGASSLAREDIWQYGVEGLMTAAARFDWRRGTKFSTSAIWWIRQRLSRALMNEGFTIREPVHVQTARAKAKRLGESFTPRPLTLSLDRPLEADEPDLLMSDSVADPSIPAPDDPLLHEERRALLLEAIAHECKPSEAKVVVLRFGLMPGYEEGLTLEQVGHIMGFSRERARQLEASAVLKLRRHLDYDAGTGLRKRAAVVYLQPQAQRVKPGPKLGSKHTHTQSKPSETTQRPAHPVTPPATEIVTRGPEHPSSRQQQTRPGRRAPSPRVSASGSAEVVVNLPAIQNAQTHAAVAAGVGVSGAESTTERTHSARGRAKTNRQTA